MYYVYLLQNERGRFYLGFTKDLRRRLKEHNSGEARSSKPYRPWKLIFYEAYLSRQDAERREMYLKTAKGRTTIRTMLKNTLSTGAES